MRVKWQRSNILLNLPLDILRLNSKFFLIIWAVSQEIRGLKTTELEKWLKQLCSVIASVVYTVQVKTEGLALSHCPHSHSIPILFSFKTSIKKRHFLLYKINKFPILSNGNKRYAQWSITSSVKCIKDRIFVFLMVISPLYKALKTIKLVVKTHHFYKTN